MYQQKPLISIITVSFNSESTICQTIESVLNQSYSNIEYIIIDGNSTDNTLKIIEAYKLEFDKKEIVYKYISELDKGIYDAINKGIKMSSGEWLNILGSDDWLESSACEIITESSTTESQSADVLYGMSKYYFNSKLYKVGQYMPEFLEIHMLNHQAIFIRKKLHDIYGLYDASYKLAADYDFFLRLKLLNKNFQFIDKFIVNYNMNGASNNEAIELEYLSIRKKYKLITKFNYYYHFLKLKFKFILNSITNV